MRDKSADSSNGEPKNSKSAAGDTGEEELEDADNDGSSVAESDNGEAKKAYKPHIPGRVLYIYRSALDANCLFCCMLITCSADVISLSCSGSFSKLKMPVGNALFWKLTSGHSLENLRSSEKCSSSAS